MKTNRRAFAAVTLLVLALSSRPVAAEPAGSVLIVGATVHVGDPLFYKLLPVRIRLELGQEFAWIGADLIDRYDHSQ